MPQSLVGWRYHNTRGTEVATAGWEPHRAVAAGRTLRGLTQQELADRLHKLTGDKWTRGMVASLEIGKKHLGVTTLTAISVTLDLPYSYFLQGVEDEFRALNRAIPGYVNPTPALSRIPADNLNHDPTMCFDCIVDPDHLVDVEWLTPGGQLPGQTRILIDISEEAFAYPEAV
jgi:transcriptional regulator with XRE-family HTH domain